MDKKEPRVEYIPVLSDASFNFECSPEWGCSHECCNNVTVTLTPYDVLRMKKALDLSSEEFLPRYTVTLKPKVGFFPLVVLKMMEETSGKPCPFVNEKGCKIFPDRPKSCRMFPLEQDKNPSMEDTYYLLKKKGFLGWEKENEWSVYDWIFKQEIDAYEKMDYLFKAVIFHQGLNKTSEENPKVIDMIYMALYNLDRFRRFILESRFLSLMDIPKDRIEKISVDDQELMLLGFDWIRFSFFGGKTMNLRSEQTQDQVEHK